MTGSWGIANSQHRVPKGNDLKATSNILTSFRMLTSLWKEWLRMTKERYKTYLHVLSVFVWIMNEQFNIQQLARSDWGKICICIKIVPHVLKLDPGSFRSWTLTQEKGAENYHPWWGYDSLDSMWPPGASSYCEINYSLQIIKKLMNDHYVVVMRSSCKQN